MCPVCKLEMEDEYHLNVYAPPGKTNVLLDNLKNDHLIRVNKMLPNEIFMFLINLPSENSETQKIIARHVFECFKIRNEKEEKSSVKYVHVYVIISNCNNFLCKVY